MLRCVALALALAAALAASPAAAAPTGPPLSTWVPDGEVKAVAISGQTAYIGGNFGRVAPYTGGSVRIDSTSAAAKTPWPDVAGTVYAVASDGVGGWYLGGDFAAVAGVGRQNLAHVLANGTLDLGWTASTSGVVRALVVGNGFVFAGGTFSTANGTARDNLAVFETGNGALANPNIGVTGTPDHFCTGPGFEDRVFSLAFSGSTLFVAGIFDSAHGTTTQARNGLAAFSVPSGAVTGFDGNMQSGAFLQPVYSIQADGDGAGDHVYVGGCLTKVNGGAANRSGVARLGATTGAVDAGWVPSGCCGSQVDTIALSGNRLYVAGFLASFRDTMALNLVDGAVDAAWNPPMHDQTHRVTSIFPMGSTVYLGGDFVSDDGTRRHLAAVNASTSAFTSWAPDGAGFVRAIGAAGSDVVAGGPFETYGGVPRRDLAAIDLSTGMPTAFHAPISEQFAGLSSVDAVAVGDGAVWAAGGFSTTGPPALNGLAAFDPASGDQTTFDKQVTGGGVVRSLAASGPLVYIGGNFNNIGGAQRRGIALIRHVPGDQGSVERFDADVTGDVRALALSGDTLYAAGVFNTVNATGVGAVRNNLAAVDGTSGDVRAFDPNVDGAVNSLAVDGGTVFAGGEFMNVNGGGAARQRIAAVDGTSGAALPWRADADGPVSALALHGRTLFAGGAFGTLGGSARPGIGALDEDSAALADWPPFTLVVDPLSGGKFPGPEPTVPVTSALGVGGSTGLVMGGDFRLTTPEMRLIHYAAFRLPPLAPSGVSAAGGDGQATVSFSSPPGDGGSPVTSFTVVASPGGKTASGAGGPLVVGGLDNGTAYTFTVRASNAVGEGPPSAPSNAVTPAGPVVPPGANRKPRILSFTALRRRFRVGRRSTPLAGSATKAAKRKRAKRGTTLRLTLSEAAQVRFVVLAKQPGRKVGKKCRKPTRKNRLGKRCTRLVRKRAFVRAMPTGKSKTPFTGRFRKRALKAGRYVIRATPTDLAGLKGARRALSITIVR